MAISVLPIETVDLIAASLGINNWRAVAALNCCAQKYIGISARLFAHIGITFLFGVIDIGYLQNNYPLHGIFTVQRFPIGAVYNKLKGQPFNDGLDPTSPNTTAVACTFRYECGRIREALYTGEFCANVFTYLFIHPFTLIFCEQKPNGNIMISNMYDSRHTVWLIQGKWYEGMFAPPISLEDSPLAPYINDIERCIIDGKFIPPLLAYHG